MQVWKRRNHRHRPWWVRHHGCQLSSNTSSLLSIYTERVSSSLLRTLMITLWRLCLRNYQHWRCFIFQIIFRKWITGGFALLQQFVPFPFRYWLRQNCVTHVHQLLAICLKSATLYLFKSVMQFHGKSPGLQNPIKFIKSPKSQTVFVSEGKAAQLWRPLSVNFKTSLEKKEETGGEPQVRDHSLWSL